MGRQPLWGETILGQLSGFVKIEGPSVARPLIYGSQEQILMVIDNISHQILLKTLTHGLTRYP